MKHPHSRSERRYAREVARNRYRKQLYLWHRWGRPTGEQILEFGLEYYGPVWGKGGKRPYAHGNRCRCHYEKHAGIPKISDLRRIPLEDLMQVEFECGAYTSIEEFPDGTDDDTIQDAFDAWVENRCDVGWTVVED